MTPLTGQDVTPRWIDDLTEAELLEAVTDAMDEQGYAVSWKIAKRLEERGFNVSPQGMAGALRRHPALVYDFDYGYGRGRRAWRLR